MLESCPSTLNKFLLAGVRTVSVLCDLTGKSSNVSLMQHHMSTLSLPLELKLVGGRRLIVQRRQMANVLPIQCVVGVLVKSFCTNQNGNIFLSNKKAHDKTQDAVFKCNEFSLCALAISNAHRQNFVSKCDSKNRRRTAHACVWQPPWASQQPIFCDPNRCCF